MAIYTVHVPDNAPDFVTRADRTVLLREGFSARAFLFGLPFLLWHRLWAAAAVWIALLALLLAFARILHPPAAGLVALAGLMHLYLGCEGMDLRRWGLARRGYTMRDIVSASGIDAAEAVYFARLPAPAETGVPRAVPRRPAPSGTPAVIGFFPEGDGA